LFPLNKLGVYVVLNGMQKVFHRAEDRGFANHGWLKARHSFSFANYFDRNKVHFGKLRVLNDDSIAPGKGFGLHPHEDMEIITIPLSGVLRHTDNMGNEGIIRAGEVQVMSAGTGVMHSEFNASESEELNLFQIWIFTDKNGHQPRYDQKLFKEEDRQNAWQLLVSPEGESGSLRIHQQAYISQINTVGNNTFEYLLHKEGNGVYLMLIEGEAETASYSLKRRDALGIWDFSGPLEINFSQNSKLLVIEVPMH
jgi:redox-sensitive bicupin YhaK (pirin superfamily)